MRSRGCWDAPGAVEEGVAQRGEDGDVVRPCDGDVGTDAAEGLEPAHAPQAPADLRLELGHSDLMVCSQLLLVLSTSKSMLKYSTWSIRLAIRLASLSASLLRPLTPGALAATPCSAVLAYRPRSWPRVAGGRLDAPASMAASTARRALLSVWRICAAQAWPCGSASQSACRSRIRWAQHSWTPVTFPPRPGSLYLW